jgi:hypothetical protein
VRVGKDYRCYVPLHRLQCGRRVRLLNNAGGYSTACQASLRAEEVSCTIRVVALVHVEPAATFWALGPVSLEEVAVTVITDLFLCVGIHHPEAVVDTGLHPKRALGTVLGRHGVKVCKYVCI